MPDGGIEGVAVGIGAEAGDHAQRQVAEVALAAERFTRVRVGQVDFDEGDRDRGQSIAQRNRSVGEGGRIDDDERRSVRFRRLDAFDQRVLGIRLEAFQCMPGLPGAVGEAGIDRGQGGMAVDLRLAIAEQVEVGAVQDQDPG